MGRNVRRNVGPPACWRHPWLRPRTARCTSEAERRAGHATTRATRRTHVCGCFMLTRRRRTSDGRSSHTTSAPFGTPVARRPQLTVSSQLTSRTPSPPAVACRPSKCRTRGRHGHAVQAEKHVWTSSCCACTDFRVPKRALLASAAASGARPGPRTSTAARRAGAAVRCARNVWVSGALVGGTRWCAGVLDINQHCA